MTTLHRLMGANTSFVFIVSHDGRRNMMCVLFVALGSLPLTQKLSSYVDSLDR